MFYLVGIFRILSQGNSISSDLRELLWGGEGRSQVIQKFFNKGQVVWMSKIDCKLKKTRYLKLRNFSAFLCMGRCERPGSLKSFLWYILQLSRPVPYFLILSSSGLSIGSMAARWPAFFPFLSSFRLTGSYWRAGIADDCDILIFWYGRKCSISQWEHSSSTLLANFNHTVQCYQL